MTLNATHRSFIERELLVWEEAQDRVEVEAVKALREKYRAKARELESVPEGLSTLDGLVDSNALRKHLDRVRATSSALIAMIPKGRPASLGLSRFAKAMVCIFIAAGGKGSSYKSEHSTSEFDGALLRFVRTCLQQSAASVVVPSDHTLHSAIMAERAGAESLSLFSDRPE